MGKIEGGEDQRMTLLWTEVFAAKATSHVVLPKRGALLAGEAE